MGNKRGRAITTNKGHGHGADNAFKHAQSLGEDVREVRDIEFAAEKKFTQREKRRKVMEEGELATAKKEVKVLRKAAKRGNIYAAKALDARKASIDMWRKAALKRKAQSNNVESDNDGDDVQFNVDNLKDDMIDKKTSAKIFKEAHGQRAEIREETLKSVAEEAARKCAIVSDELRDVGEQKHAPAMVSAESDDDSDDRRSLAHTDAGFASVAGDDERELDFLDASKITEEEEMALAMFSNIGPQDGVQDTKLQNNNNEAPRVMLADIILNKIREKEEEDARKAAIAADPVKAERDRKIAEVYGLVGNIMSRYKSGKVPKAFKLIAKQRNWEDLLYLTRPDEWSAATVYVATRILASNLSGKQVVKFYEDILLPRCLEDISEHKKLNYHLYRALEKAVYKPDAFNKGILFSVCEDRGCTLRQATIIGSVISKVSIPMLHSAAALLYICQLPYSPPNSIIITALLEKKYALPYRVLDAVTDSFVKMKGDSRPLPLSWHLCLLSFSQRYKMELTVEQKDKLKLLMRMHNHHSVTCEIRRELFSSRNRGDVMEPDANTIAVNIANAAMAD